MADDKPTVGAKDLKKLEELSSLTGETLGSLDDISTKYQEILAFIQKGNDAENKRARTLLEQLELRKESLDVMQKELEELKQEQSELKSVREQKEKAIEIAKKEYQLAIQRGETDETRLKILKDTIKLKEKELELEKELEGKRKKALGDLKSITDTLTGGLATQINQNITLEGYNNKLQERAKILFGLNKEIAETGAIFKGNIETFGKFLGGEYLGKFGVQQADVIKSYGELRTSMSSFTELDMQQQEQIAAHTTIMKNFGISSATVGKNYDILTKGLKASTKEVTAFSDRLMQHAIGAGIAPKKMIEEFATAAPKLMAYGKQSEEIFIKLQKQAKSLGMEMQSLTAIVGDQFDTFEGSARAAGKLNSILGGNYLNSVEMLNATEDERIILLKQAMEESGKSFDALDKYEKKNLAASIGISNMDEASRILGGTTRELQDDMNKQAAGQTELTKVQKAAGEQAKKLEAMYDNMNNKAMEVVKAQTMLVERFTKQQEASQGAAGAIFENSQFLTAYGFSIANAIMSIGGFVGVFGGLKGLFGSISDKIKESFGKIIGSSAEVAPSIDKVGDVGNKTGSAMGASAKQMMAFGVAIALIGVGIGAAAFGFSFLVKSFKDLTGPQIIGALGAMIIVMGGMAIAISILAGAALPAAPPLLALGVAIALMSAPILAVGKALEWAGPAIAKIVEVLLEGLTKIVGAIGGVIEKIFNGIRTIIDGMRIMMNEATLGKAAALIAVAGGIAAVAAAMAGQAVAGAFSSAFEGVTKFLGGRTVTEKMKEFFDVLNSVDTAKLQAFGLFASSIGSAAFGMYAFSDGLGKMGPGITTLSNSLNSLPESKLLAFKSISDSVSGIKTNFVDTFASLPTFLNTVISKFNELTEAIKFLKEEVNSISINPSNNIKDLVSSIEKVKGFSEEQLKPTKDFLEKAKEYYWAQANSKDAANDAVVQAINSLANKVGETSSGADTSSKEIKLVIQGSDLVKALKYGDTSVKAILTGPRS